MSPSDHADFDALSAFVDREAPEWADHVAGCEACRATAAELRATSAAVGRPVGVPSPAAREAAIAAALDALPATAAGAGRSTLAPDRHENERARFARRRAARPWAMPAVAAVVLAILGVSGVVLSGYQGSEEVTVAGRALEADAKAGALAGAPQAPVGDLGEVPDAASLRNRALNVGPTGPASSTGRSSSSSNSGAAIDSGAATGPPAAVSGSSGGSGGAGSNATTSPVVPNGGLSATNGGSTGAVVVGTRPCEELARTRDPSLGPVVYFATARRNGVEGFVLGFAPVGASSPVTLLLLAQDGCRELLRSAGP